MQRVMSQGHGSWGRPTDPSSATVNLQQTRQAVEDCVQHICEIIRDALSDMNHQLGLVPDINRSVNALSPADRATLYGGTLNGGVSVNGGGTLNGGVNNGGAAVSVVAPPSLFPTRRRCF